MRSSILCVCITAITCAIAASPAFAIGLGVYGNYSIGHSYWGFHEYGAYNENHRYYGGGILFDTDVAKDRHLNYRLGIGYDSIIHDSYYNNGDLKLNRIVLSNTLGIGIHRSAIARLWLGPQFRLSYKWGVDYYYYEFDNPSGAIIFVKQKDRFQFFLADLAFVFGSNIHLPGRISLGFETGPRIFLGSGQLKSHRDSIPYSVLASPGRMDSTRELFGIEVFVNVCAIVRINDEYK